MSIRVGIGYDVHRLEEGYPLWIGGISIPHSKGSVGHSDGDTLIHAICDAMLGALALGDIGQHFPDTDPSLKGVDSKLLLKKVNELIVDKGYRIGNIDSTVSLQKPKLKDYLPKMKEVLQKILNLPQGSISIKATTTEGLGFVGREEGIAAHVVLLLLKESK